LAMNVMCKEQACDEQICEWLHRKTSSTDRRKLRAYSSAGAFCPRDLGKLLAFRRCIRADDLL